MRRSLPFPAAHAAILLGLIVLAAALRFWRLGDLPLFGDEAYYLLWSGRLAPAYYDHPAGIAVLLRASTALGGHSELGVRWLNALLSVACVPLAYAVGRRFISEAGGLFGAAVAAVAPVFVVTGRVAYPDSLQYFLLLINLLIAARLLGRYQPAPPAGSPEPRKLSGPGSSAETLAWGAFGFTLALLLNVKLSSAFYVIGLALYTFIWRRHLLRDRGLWLAVAIASLGLIPVLAWNATHDWAMIRWAIFHGQGYGFVQTGLRSSLPHARDYHSIPAALLAGLAVVAIVLQSARARTERTAPSQDGQQRADWRLLAIVSGCLALPVLLSRADSPRNLGLGLLTLWPLLGLFALGRSARAAGSRPGLLNAANAALLALAVLLCLALAAYGIGTAVRLVTPLRLPAGSVTESIRRDAGGWPAFAREFPLTPGALLFTVDYSIAGQIAYYAGRPVFTSAPQYRIWGVPEADRLVVFGTGYLAPDVVTEALRADFEEVAGPETWRRDEDGVEKIVYTWRADRRRVPMSQILDDLDYLRVIRAAGAQ